MVRNPLETIASNARNYAHQGHDLTLDQDLNTEFPEFWDKFVEATATNIARSYEFMTQKLDKIPTLFVRYEDLVLDPETTLTDLFKFMLGVEILDKTIL